MKAFDCVEWDVLFNIMSEMNFGSQYINMISNLYKDMSSCTANRGFTHNFFSITRGLRQGDPQSAPLFDILVEVLVQKIRKNDKIKGIRITPKEQKKIGQYADDLWTIVDASTEDSYKHLIKEFQDFERNTGLKVNYDKTQVMRIGSLRKGIAKFYVDKPIQWSEKIKILGIIIKADVREMIKENYELLKQKMENVLTPWRARGLTLIGRITVFNSLVASLTTQIFSCLHSPPEKFFKDTERMIKDFLWQGKRPKIALKRLSLPYEEGGLKLVSLYEKNIAMKIKWLEKFWKEKESCWVKTAGQILPLPFEQILDCDIKEKDIEKVRHSNNMEFSLWYDIWQAWAKYKNSVTQKTQCFWAEQMLWYNSDIRRNNLPYCEKSLYNLGILKIKHIVNEKEKRLLTYEEICAKTNTKVNFLAYYALINAIASKGVTYDEVENFSKIFQTKIKTIKTTKMVYAEMIISNSQIKDISRELWQKEIDEIMTEEQWKKLRLATFKDIKSVKLQFFQYRVLSRKIVTNVIRAKYDSTITSKCYYCQLVPETMMHLVVDCSKIKKFWSAIFKWMQYILEQSFQIERKNLILSNFTGQNSLLINQITVLVKQYIYATKCQAKKLNVNTLLYKLHLIYLYEKHHAIKENRMYKFTKKWKIYQEKLMLS